MNCEECKNIISLFLDCELEHHQADSVRMHLALCGDCAQVCEELATLLDSVSDEDAELLIPNSQALWCRINNIIESESKPVQLPQSEASVRRTWRMGVSQLVAAVLLIGMVSSLVTIIALRSYSPADPEEFAVGRVSDRTILDRVLGRLGLAETPQEIREKRLRKQQDAIEYWNARVQSRRMMWDEMTREAFDRNLRVIDQSVSQFSINLQRDPEDELSGEMLDSVLDDKMKLLRDFADL